jgi:hypothetical protein
LGIELASATTIKPPNRRDILFFATGAAAPSASPFRNLQFRTNAKVKIG